MDAIFPYVSNLALFDCPDAHNKTWPSYAYNAAFSGLASGYYTADAPAGNYVLSEVQLASPASIILACDGNDPYTLAVSAVNLWFGRGFSGGIYTTSGSTNTPDRL